LLAVVDLGTPHIAGYSLDGKVNGTRQIYAAACRHFGIAPTWTPQLPPPPVPRIEMTVAHGDDDEDVLRRIITRVYDITADDAALRRRTREFDRLRTEYPARREFFNTTLALRGAGESLRRTCAALGFRVDEA
jgi:erythronate-4-phosphate dehydrogenase